MGEARLHAVISPSNFKAVMLCPGKPAMEKGLPDDSNEYSDEGTCAHAIAALCLTEGEPAIEYVGRVIEVGPDRTYTFRADMVEPVQVYVDLVRTYHASIPNSALHVEVKVPIDHITGETDATGTADAVIVGVDEIICCDLKFGMGVEVSAEENPQLMGYGSGAIRKFDDLGTVSRLRAVISQPRLNPKPSEWDCTTERLRVFESEMSEAAGLALSLYNAGPYRGGLGLNPHDDACQFCKAKPTCPALAKLVADTVGVGFEVLSDQPAQPLEVGDDLEEIGRKFRSIGLIERFCKAIRAKAEAALFERNNSEEAQKALGIKLVMGRAGSATWLDTDAVEKQLKQWRLRQEDMYSFEVLSPTKMRAFVKANGKKGWPEKLEAFITRADGKPSVASLSDKRPALVLTATSEGFEVTTKEEELG